VANRTYFPRASFFSSFACAPRSVALILPFFVSFLLSLLLKDKESAGEKQIVYFNIGESLGG